MRPEQDVAVTKAGHEAASISALLAMMSGNLGSDPDTSYICEALDGLQVLAQRVSDSLFDLVQEIRS